MRNKLTDLNNLLFAQLERLSDEDLKGDALKEETKRAQAVSSVAKQVIDGGRLSLRAQVAYDERIILAAPEMIGIEQKK